MSLRMLPALLAGAVLALAPTAASAADPGTWLLAQADSVPSNYFQGLTHNGASVLFVGLFEGAYRTDLNLKEITRVDTIYPAELTAMGFNHVGDPTFDASAEGGRLLAPMECYHPGTPQPNSCGVGGFGVVDPVTLAWRYWVRLDQADIPKAMWAETSPDGTLVWTSSGNDLLAYRTADIAAANAASGLDSPPIHPARRLPGTVPPSGITGAVFHQGRLFLAGADDDLLQVWSVDVDKATPMRLELELPGVIAESEGLDFLDMRGGVLHWLLSSIVTNPTYGSGHSELLTFLPRASARLHVAAKRVGKGARVTVTTVFEGKSHPVTGAAVKAGSKSAKTNAHGVATFARVPHGKVALKATKLALLPGTKTLG